MIRLTVRRRILLLLLAVSLIPLALINIIWFLSSQDSLKQAAVKQQTLLVKSSADSVNYYINGKIDVAIIHSQSPALQSDTASAQADLADYLKQDADITQLTLTDSKGVRRIQMDRLQTSTQAADMSGTDAFRVVTFLSGNEYIGPVRYDAKNDPYLTLSVPIINFVNSQSGLDLSTSEPGVVRSATDIKGVLIANISLKSLWNKVLSSKLGKSGYAYVVDDKGDLIAYPNTGYMLSHHSLASVPEVQSALKDVSGPDEGVNSAPSPQQTKSETGATVLSSHAIIPRTQWAVIAEEPISSVYAQARHQVGTAFIFFVFAALIGMAIILLGVRGLTKPIRLLTEGAARVGRGDLRYHIILNRQDEFGVLAQTVNQMADALRGDIEKLKEVDKLKTEFITIASHNLRTPLTIITGYLDLLKDRPVPADMREMLEKVRAGAQTLNTFSEDLLTISSIEEGKARLDVKDITIQELFGPLQESYSDLARQKSIDLHWLLPAPSTAVRLSPTHIRSSLNNLFQNAIKFTPNGGRVDIVFEIQAGQYVIIVRDTGTGIKPEEMSKLFTKFHRGTSTLQYDYAGIGIGLYATRLIVEAHGGKINAMSTPGLGSVFTITIPANPDLNTGAQA